jgi:hypothetical protein
MLYIALAARSLIQTLELWHLNGFRDWQNLSLLLENHKASNVVVLWLTVLPHIQISFRKIIFNNNDFCREKYLSKM